MVRNIGHVYGNVEKVATDNQSLPFLVIREEEEEENQSALLPYFLKVPVVLLKDPVLYFYGESK